MCGHLLPDRRHVYLCRHVKVRSGFLVNRLLSQVDRWESIFTVFRDLEPLFDHINLSTALHRLARTSYKHRVRPHPSESMRQPLGML